MRLFVSVMALVGIISQPVFAQNTGSRGPAVSSAEIEKGIDEAAKSLESLSRLLAIMGPSLSKAMQASAPSLGRALERAQPSLQRAMRTAQPQMDALGSPMATRGPRAPNAGPPTGADMSRSIQAAASSLESLSRIMGSVAPDLGKAYDAAAPELRNALAQARPALEDAMKAAEPELRRLTPAAPRTNDSLLDSSI